MNVSAEITIVIPVYNRAHIVGRTLESIRQQTFRPLAVVLVDNNSTDNTMEVLQRWKTDTETPGFRIEVLSETTPGAAAARNRGLKNVASEFVMFFDSDDTMAPTHVERAVEALHSPSHPDIAGWDIAIHTLPGKRLLKNFYTRDTIWHCVMHGLMGTQRFASRTELVRNAGEWNINMRGWDDIELGIRMLLKKPRIVKVPRPIGVQVFEQEESITGTDFASTPQKWEKALDEIERNLPTQRTKRYVQLRRALLAGDYAREKNRKESDRLLTAVLEKERCPFYRAIYRLTRFYVANKGRGGARLLRPLF